MKKTRAILAKIGPIPMILSGLAIIAMVFAAQQSPMTTESTSIWGEFVAWMTHAIVGVAQYFNNSYGWGIVVFTILIRFLILPLMVYQVGEMTKMQALQPKIKALQAKYSSRDQETMAMLQSEQRALYKETGVNPFASLLPLLVQLPILIGLYQAIFNSDVLQSGQFLWLQLGDVDPYFILPFLAALFTFVSSWLAMQSNPDQNGFTKAMPYIFPVVIFISALFVPSALALYWVVSNAFQTVQTFILQNPFKIRAERAALKQAQRDKQRQINKALRAKKKKR
jgi:YidC/Oxa1 family membrane protein insertase